MVNKIISIKYLLRLQLRENENSDVTLPWETGKEMHKSRCFSFLCELGNCRARISQVLIFVLKKKT